MKKIWRLIVDVWFLARLLFAAWRDQQNDTAPAELKEGEHSL